MGVNVGHIYIIENEHGLVKIGRSIEPQKRIRTLETQGGAKITRIFISDEIECYNLAEIFLHNLFKEHRTIGEWFNMPFQYASAVAEKKPWKNELYFKAVEKSRKEPEMDPGAILDAFQQATLGYVISSEPTPAQFFNHTYHCDLCRCPIEEYKHFATYQSDRGCELHQGYWAIKYEFLNRYGSVHQNVLVSTCIERLRGDYPGVPDFQATINEFIEIDTDLGELDWLRPDVLCEYSASQEAKRLEA